MEKIVLTEVTNQYGNTIPASWLECEDGEWWHAEIACRSSRQFGLGNCNCNSHNSIEHTKISHELAMECIANSRVQREKKLFSLKEGDQEFEDLKARVLMALAGRKKIEKTIISLALEFGFIEL